MRRIMLIFLVGTALLAIMVVAPVVWQGSDKPAEATPGLVLGFDMDPTGNSCPNDGTDCALGPIDTCVEVSEGDVFQFDVFLDGLPVDDGILGFSYNIDTFPGTLTAQAHEDSSVNLIAQPGSSLFGFSEGIPDSSPPWSANVADLAAAEFNPPFTKGVLGRYTLDVTGVPEGVYGLTLSEVKLVNYESPPQGLCKLYSCEIWDAAFSPHYGVIAVDVACGSAPPIITPTPSPTLTPTVSPTLTPTASPTVTPTPRDLVAGWNHTCYLGTDLPISEALADLTPSVLAVYRLRPDQGYDKWFPGSPDASNITTVTPYEPLFILMANDAAWPQEPGAAPPTGLDLAQGWDSACYCGQTKDVQSATASIAGQCEVLYLLTAGQGWKWFVPAKPEISNLAELQQFAAVLTLVTQPGGAHWVFDP